MGSNNYRLEACRKAIKRHSGEYQRDSAILSSDFLEMCFSIAFSNYQFYEVLGVHMMFGLPIVVTNHCLYLFLPYLDNMLLPCQNDDGEIDEKITLNDITNRFRELCDYCDYRGKIMTIKVFTNLGLINKDKDSDFNRTQYVMFKNKTCRFKVDLEDIYNEKTS